MMADDTSGSSSSGAAVDSPLIHSLRSKQNQTPKLEAYNEVLRRLREDGLPEAQSSSFKDALWSHFNRLPARYALDINLERAEDVLAHKKLLELAPAETPVFDIRVVQGPWFMDENHDDSSNVNSPIIRDDHVPATNFKHSIHPLLAFSSSKNLEALATKATRHQIEDYASTDNSTQSSRPMHEITFATHEKPKLLSLEMICNSGGAFCMGEKLTSLLSELGLNIQEVHAFSTNDGYSLNVFVVDGWPYEEIEQLRASLEKEAHKIGKEAWSRSCPLFPIDNNIQFGEEDFQSVNVESPTDGSDAWKIDFQLLKFGNKVASGSHSDLYQGTYCTQEVAIKVLKTECVDENMQREFAQEVFIMRNVHHENVVKFIGACTKPKLCIITEFMTGGSVYDFLHKKKKTFELPSLLRVAIDVCNGMNYLHRNNIIHRDLKSANLLMDENEVVKVADFGVARVKPISGVMTAETGTYRWMAPEVIQHKPYDHKADIFSFGIVIWELLTAKLPYQYLTPIQAAVGVVQQGLRPTIPNTHPKLAKLLERCWKQDPADRPDFSEILEILHLIAGEVEDEAYDSQKETFSVGFFWFLRFWPLNRYCCV